MGQLGKEGALGFLRRRGMGRARDGPDPAILRISVGSARDLPIPNAALDPNLLVYGRLWTLVSDRVDVALTVIGGADVGAPASFAFDLDSRNLPTYPRCRYCI